VRGATGDSVGSATGGAVFSFGPGSRAHNLGDCVAGGDVGAAPRSVGRFRRCLAWLGVVVAVLSLWGALGGQAGRWEGAGRRPPGPSGCWSASLAAARGAAWQGGRVRGREVRPGAGGGAKKAGLLSAMRGDGCPGLGVRVAPRRRDSLGRGVGGGVNDALWQVEAVVGVRWLAL